MQRIQLYIENNDGNYPLVDMFDDETVQLTSTIQDIRDIGKVFTDFSMPFTVPASETNNKIFRHFYNYNITGNAFDARKKKKAKIHINYMPFREGKIFLNSVKMKMNKPYAYEVIFYGNTVSIKDLIGDDELTDLDYLSNYNHQYSESNVRDGITNGLNLNSQTNSIIYPLITSKKRLFFNSDTQAQMDSYSFYNSSGNLYCDESNLPDSLDTSRGLEYTDLKPAIRSIHIIEAIESKYNLSFTRDFFDSDAFDNLYLWVNSKKGEFNDLDDDEGYLFSHKLTGYTTTGTELGSAFFDGSDITLGSTFGSHSFSLDLTLSNQGVPYRVVFRDKTRGNEKVEKGLGDSVFDFDLNDSDYTGDIVMEIEIQSDSEFSITGADLDIVFTSSITGQPFTYNYSATDSIGQSTTAEILIQDRFPKMKVIDFLTGLFKMFNLTAYYIDDFGDPEYGKVYVDTLDNYYEDAVNNKLGSIIEIEKYVDASQHSVDSLLPFTDINFNYQETNTVLMENHFEQFNEVFGDAEYNVREGTKDQVTGEYAIDRGTKYDISIPFSHMKYERIVDLGQNLGVNAIPQTSIQWGYCAGGDFNANTSENTGDYDTKLIKPLLFYAIKEDGLPEASNANSFRSGRINWISTTPPTRLDSYWRPSNSSDDGTPTTPPTYSLNFDAEVDEWQSINYGIDDANSLYKVFYKSYVESVFNPLKRMFKLKAFLPPNIIINYRLNHQIKIRDKIFRINSITTNLMTGESELELLNIFSNEIVQ